MSAEPALLAISHGTSSAHGQRVVTELAASVQQSLRARGLGARVLLGHVDVQQPDVPAVLNQVDPQQSGVLVPLLLSTGFHVKVDLHEAVGHAAGAAVITPALGPDDRLVQVLAQRLEAARLEAAGGDPASDHIILGAAGSSDPSAAADCREVARRLSAQIGAAVQPAFLAFASPSIPDAVTQARREYPDRRIIIVSYLLAPGYFQSKLEKSGADLTTAALLDAEVTPPELTEIVISRYLAHQPDHPAGSAPEGSAALIHPADLHQLLSSAHPPQILDVRWRQDRPEGLPEYLEGHIPGALFVDLDYELAATGKPSDEGRHPLPSREEFTETVQRWGLNPHETVVVYDDMKNLSAARAWWLLRHAGFTDVRILDGSLRGWTAAGYPLETGMALAEDVALAEDAPLPSGAPHAGIPESGLRWGAMRTASAEEVLDRNTASTLIDARPARRFAGVDDPLSPRPGHIPGAISAPTAGNVDEHGRLLSAETLRRRYLSLGVNPAQPVYCYCYSGIHSAHTVLALTRAGFEAVLYPGGFGQWSQRQELKVITGEAPNRE